MIRNLYHLVLMVGVWLLKKLKIFEYLSGSVNSLILPHPLAPGRNANALCGYLFPMFTEYKYVNKFAAPQIISYKVVADC